MNIFLHIMRKRNDILNKIKKQIKEISQKGEDSGGEVKKEKK